MIYAIRELINLLGSRTFVSDRESWYWEENKGNLTQQPHDTGKKTG